MILAQALIAGLIIQANVVCASPEPLHRIAEAQAAYGVTDADDMLDGALRRGECFTRMPFAKIPVRMIEAVADTEIGAHIWSGTVNGFEVFLLVADDFVMGKPI